jgi:hypothetical protein
VYDNEKPAKLRASRRNRRSANPLQTDIGPMIHKLGSLVLVESWTYREHLERMYWSSSEVGIRERLQSMWAREVQQLQHLPDAILPRWLVRSFSSPLGSRHESMASGPTEPTNVS